MIWKRLFISAAYIAALFHDSGYPWQYVNNLSKKLDHVGNNDTRGIFDIDRFSYLYHNRLLYCPFKGYSYHENTLPITWHDPMKNTIKQALQQTHGLPGAISFLHLHDAVREYPNIHTDYLSLFCVEWAAMGIMMHDMVDLYWGGQSIPANPHFRLHIQRDPLSCIISLADVIQDFCRPYAKFISNPSANIEVDYSHTCSQTEVACNDSKKRLTVTYTLLSPTDLAAKRRHILKEGHNYFDSQYGYIDLSAIGINHIMLKAR